MADPDSVDGSAERPGLSFVTESDETDEAGEEFFPDGEREEMSFCVTSDSKSSTISGYSAWAGICKPAGAAVWFILDSACTTDLAGEVFSESAGLAEAGSAASGSGSSSILVGELVCRPGMLKAISLRIALLQLS